MTDIYALKYISVWLHSILVFDLIYSKGNTLRFSKYWKRLLVKKKKYVTFFILELDLPHSSKGDIYTWVSVII